MAACMLTLVASTSCGGSESSNVNNGRPVIEQSPEKTAQIYSVPLPGAATPEPGAATSEKEVYRLPPGLPITAVTGFYNERMPLNRPFKELEWCGTAPVAGPVVPTLERVWRAPGTNDFLVLQILQERDGTLVNIIDSRNDANRACQKDSGSRAPAK